MSIRYPKKSSHSTHPLLYVIMAFGMLFSCFFYTGPYFAYDDAGYIAYAHQMLNGNFSAVQSASAFGYLSSATIALSFRLFGYGQLQSILPSMVEYLLIILLAFHVGRALYDDAVGYFAALFSATAPFVVQYVTRAMPDMLLGALAGLAIYTFIMAGRHRQHRKVFYFVSGAMTALTIYVKLEGIAFVLFFFVAAMLMTYKDRNQHSEHYLKSIKTAPTKGDVVFVLIGIAALICINVIITYASTGNPLFTILAYGQWQHSISPTSLHQNIYTLLVTVCGYLDTAGSTFGAFVLSPTIYPYGFVIYFAILGTIIGIGTKSRNTLFLAVIGWGTFFYFFFGTMTMTAYTFIPVSTRLFTIIEVPFSVLSAYGSILLYNMARNSNGKVVSRLIFAIFILEIALFSVPTFVAIHYYNSAIAADGNVLNSIANYMSSNSGSYFILGNSSDVTNFIGLISGYKTSIQTLGGRCTSSYNGTHILAVYGNDRSNDGVVLDQWAGKNCSLSISENYSTSSYSSNPYHQLLINGAVFRVIYEQK